MHITMLTYSQTKECVSILQKPCYVERKIVYTDSIFSSDIVIYVDSLIKGKIVYCDTLTDSLKNAFEKKQIYNYLKIPLNDTLYQYAVYNDYCPIWNVITQLSLKCIRYKMGKYTNEEKKSFCIMFSKDDFVNYSLLKGTIVEQLAMYNPRIQKGKTISLGKHQQWIINELNNGKIVTFAAKKNNKLICKSFNSNLF